MEAGNRNRGTQPHVSLICIFILTIAIIAVLGGGTQCSPPGTHPTQPSTSTPTSSSQPSPSSSVTDTVDLNKNTANQYNNTVFINSVPMDGSSPGAEISPTTTVSTDATGSADITFSGKNVMCTINSGVDITSALCTRPQETYLFQQYEGKSLVVWTADPTKPDQYIGVGEHLTITSTDPALRIVVVPKQQAKVAAYQGYADLAIKPLEGKTIQSMVTEGKEAVVDLARPQAPEFVDAVFTPREIESFQRMAGKLDIVLPPPVPLYQWSIPFVNEEPLMPFDDIRVREAVSLALNEPAIIADLFGEGMIRFEPQQEFASGENNLERAAQLLNEAGYPGGFQVVFFVAPVSDSAIMKLAEVIAADLAKAGIQTELAEYDRVEDVPMEGFSIRLFRIEVP